MMLRDEGAVGMFAMNFVIGKEMMLKKCMNMNWVVSKQIKYNQEYQILLHLLKDMKWYSKIRGAT